MNELLSVCAYCQRTLDEANNPEGAERSLVRKSEVPEDHHSHGICNNCNEIERGHLEELRRLKALRTAAANHSS